MSQDTGLDLVTGAFSNSGSRIAERLLDSGRAVRTLTFHPDRQHPLRARVETFPYRFDDAVALARSLQGAGTLYNTYWVRFDHGRTTFANAIANSRTLFYAAQRAGVARVVHISIGERAPPPLRTAAMTLIGRHPTVAAPSWRRTATSTPWTVVVAPMSLGGRRSSQSN